MNARVEMKRETDGLYTYRAVIEFAIGYQLPEGVYEFAVLKAIREPTFVTVESLETVTPEGKK